MIESKGPGNQPGMKRLLILALLSSSFGAWASPRLELEVGGGATGTASLRPDLSPSLGARVGVDLWEHFTPSLRVLTLSPLGSDHTSWATLAEARIHSSGIFQVSAALGAGFGNAEVGTQPALDAQFFQVKPYLEGDVGARVMIGRFWIGLNVGGMPLDRTWIASLNVGVAAFGGGED